MNTMNFGILYVVATPIGNLGDISLRAIEVLKQADYIATEDTRHSSKLLSHFNIKKSMISFHDHNESVRNETLLRYLQKGKNIALISDAGTPLINDPGYKLVLRASKQGIRIIPIPGACAAITALSASGLPTDKFVFEGFLPVKSVARNKRLKELRLETRTLVLYEAPHRLIFLARDLYEIFEHCRQVVIARELTKTFETIHSTTVSELKNWIEKNSNQQKGEIVVLIHGAKKIKEEINKEDLKILEVLSSELPTKQAAALTSKITGIRKNKLYKIANKFMLSS